ncbi:MAG TPA: hypothetical protein VLG49_07955 [Rhabdochlamydiaceae bacterium]|nr:hypothetical protein [Rhabdochlamydiaceae bacterium]
MQIHEKALYNLLRINKLEDSSVDALPWQVEDYRKLSTDQMFKRLKKLGISLTQDSFLTYAKSCDSPEALTEFLWTKDENAQEYDQTYLLLFELWRRLLPEEQSLSIFCDELDYRIHLYDKKLLSDDALIQDILKDLEDILDRGADEGENPKKVFNSLAEHCAHDLERFLYDYIAEQIDDGNDMYASELLDGFYEYVPDRRWFDFLRARLFAATDFEGATTMLRRLIDSAQEEPDFDLLLEIVSFLVHSTDPRLFLDSASAAFQLIKTESDFQDLVGLAAEYYRLSDREEEDLFLKKLLGTRSKNDLSAFLPASDKGMAQFAEFLDQAL